MKILVVEDDLDVLECIRSYLTGHGHQVTAACTMQEAVRWLEHDRPDMAFVDLILPNGHGRGVIQKICRQGIPAQIVVVTASDDLTLRKELLHYGVTHYLFKPITIHDLEALVA